MNIRFEDRGAFHVSGFSVESNESSHEKDIALLRYKHEDNLKAIAEKDSGLYFVTWLTGEDTYIYHFGIEGQDQNLADIIGVEVPAGCFAVATVPAEMPLLEAWGKLFEIDLLPLGYNHDPNAGKYFEFHNNSGVEIWIPVRVKL